MGPRGSAHYQVQFVKLVYSSKGRTDRDLVGYAEPVESACEGGEVLPFHGHDHEIPEGARPRASVLARNSGARIDEVPDGPGDPLRLVLTDQLLVGAGRRYGKGADVVQIRVLYGSDGEFSLRELHMYEKYGHLIHHQQQ